MRSALPTAARVRQCLVVVTFALTATACQPDREAVPDPEKPPLPKVEQQAPSPPARQ